MENWIAVLLKGFWCGWAALGFAVLFNVPKKILYIIWFGGAITGLVKYSVMDFAGLTIIHASFVASLVTGVYCLLVARQRTEPMMIFAIPSVIPLVPGVYAYRTMLGLIKLSGEINDAYSRTLAEAVRNGAMTLFIVIAFSLGIIITIQLGKRIQE